jgi:hypothetical protein
MQGVWAVLSSPYFPYEFTIVTPTPDRNPQFSYHSKASLDGGTAPPVNSPGNRSWPGSLAFMTISTRPVFAVSVMVIIREYDPDWSGDGGHICVKSSRWTSHTMPRGRAPELWSRELQVFSSGQISSGPCGYFSPFCLFSAEEFLRVCSASKFMPWAIALTDITLLKVMTSALRMVPKVSSGVVRWASSFRLIARSVILSAVILTIFCLSIGDPPLWVIGAPDIRLGSLYNIRPRKESKKNGGSKLSYGNLRHFR